MRSDHTSADPESYPVVWVVLIILLAIYPLLEVAFIVTATWLANLF